MLRALLLVAREIALAHDRWLAQLVRRRPLAAEKGESKPKGRSPEARRVQELGKEIRRKDKALAEAAALLVLQKKKSASCWGEGTRALRRGATRDPGACRGGRPLGSAPRARVRGRGHGARHS